MSSPALPERLRHVVHFSTGIGSAEVLRRAAVQAGARNITALTADTLVEDEDNWRFAREVIHLVGCRWVVLADGRTPMQVGRDERCVPNNRMAVCSRILKRELLDKWVAENCGEDTIHYMGFDWTEPHRLKDFRQKSGYRTEAPLMDEPLMQKADLIAYWRDELGIEPPRLYAEGFPHANCGGCCVRGGQAAWALALRQRPSVYAQWEAEEESTRTLLGKDVSILRDRRGGSTTPLTLRAFRERIESQLTFDGDDWGACACY